VGDTRTLPSAKGDVLDTWPIAFDDGDETSAAFETLPTP